VDGETDGPFDGDTEGSLLGPCEGGRLGLDVGCLVRMMLSDRGNISC